MHSHFKCFYENILVNLYPNLPAVGKLRRQPWERGLQRKAGNTADKYQQPGFLLFYLPQNFYFCLMHETLSEHTRNILGLQLPTDPRWVNLAEIQLAEILTDHAWCEQKAATNAITIIINKYFYNFIGIGCIATANFNRYWH